jgi:hypothetical protein
MLTIVMLRGAVSCGAVLRHAVRRLTVVRWLLLCVLPVRHLLMLALNCQTYFLPARW